MPYVDTPAVRLHYLIEGRDNAPWLILSNSLGTTLDMWSPQMPALLQHFRVLRYDTRGHGLSSIPGGPYNINQLGNDVVTLMDRLDIQRAHFCGLSMGGMTGIWMGIHQASRIDRLVLCNTGAKIGTAEAWTSRIDKVCAEGMAAIVSAVIERWFTTGYQQREPEQIAKVRRMLLDTDPAGYAANCAAVRDMDQRDGLSTIKVPTLVVAGTHDLATTPQDGKQVAEHVAGARYVELNAAHLSNLEAVDAFNAEVVKFLTHEEQGA